MKNASAAFDDTQAEALKVELLSAQKHEDVLYRKTSRLTTQVDWLKVAYVHIDFCACKRYNNKHKSQLGVIDMGTIEEIIKMAKKNNSTVTTAMITAAGFSRGNLQYLVDKGLLEKATRGVYILPEVWEDEIFNLQCRFKRGIYSLETALFLWDLTDQTPNSYSMTFPTNYNLSKPKLEGIKCTQCKVEWYQLGLDKITTPSGNLVSVYNKERTLCDILRPNSLVDIQIVSESFKQYAVGKEKNIPLLSEYSKTLKVERKLRAYLEILL